MSTAFERQEDDEPAAQPATEAQLAAAILALRDILAERDRQAEQYYRLVQTLRIQVEGLRAEVAELRQIVRRRKT